MKKTTRLMLMTGAVLGSALALAACTIPAPPPAARSAANPPASAPTTEAEPVAEQPGFTGVFTASLPGPFPGRPVTLTLSGDGTANLMTNQMNGEPVVEELGTWIRNDAASATVTLAGTPDQAYDQPNVITFTLNGDQLTAVDFSQPERYGTVGLPLVRVALDTLGTPADMSVPPAELTASTWQLTGIISPTGETTASKDPTKYTLTFGEDWRVTVQADCNKGGGRFGVDNGLLKIGPIISTLAACPEGSLSSDFLSKLDQAESYSIEGDVLTIALTSEAGALQLTAAK